MDLTLSRRLVAPDPFDQLRRWLGDAEAAGIGLHDAMALATVDPSGHPSVRMVLLKGLDDGLVFFTNYDSRKAADLAAEPRAELLFHWRSLERQVRIRVRCERTSAAASAAYFATRPRGSQLGAWACDQSAPIADRAALEARYRQSDARFAGQDVPCPPHWGGYRARAERWEFWQGRQDRLHDRIVYEPDGGGGWTLVRLQP
jgi:pyridoxamine 5'-phosphate oxidase